MLTVFVVLVLLALGLVVAAAVKKAPLWMAVLVLVILELLRTLPIGR
jgi:uncharacterized membrane protein